MTRSLCCLAVLLTGLAIIPETSAQAEETPGAPRQNILDGVIEYVTQGKDTRDIWWWDDDRERRFV